MTGDASPRVRSRGRPRAAEGEKAPAPIKALDRGLALLRELARENGSSLTNIALQAGMAPPSAYRILVTLQKHGFVEFDDTTKEWSIGIEAFRTGASYLAGASLIEIARPAMRELMHSSDETANLAVPNGGDVVFLAQVEARHPIRAFFAPGERGHMHASGIGKALLAELPRETVEAVVRDRGLPRFTERTLDTPERLFADLEATRARGWSLDDEERHAGMRCIAAAIRDASGTPVAGLSISGPAVRFPDTSLDELGQRVRRAADTVTRRLGGGTPDESGYA